MQMRKKVGKSWITMFFQWFVAPEGRKVGSLKRRVRSQLARGEMKNCTPLWREAHFEVKMYKTHHCRTTLGSWDVEKVHAVVARSTFRSQNVHDTPASDHFWKLRSTFRSQNVQNTPLSDNFWKLRCRKSARRCGVKHISKSKCFKKTLGVRTTFGSWDVEKVHAVVARSTFRSQNVKNTRGSDHFWRFRCRTQGIVHLVKSEQNVRVLTPHYTPLHYTTTTTTPSLHSTTLHSTTLHCTQLHKYTTLHYITLHSTTLHSTTLHYTTFHYTSLHYTTLHSTTLQLHNYTPLHSTTLNYTPRH